MQLQVIKAQNVVEKRNILNEVKNNYMTLQELRLFSIYLSKINSRDISTRKVRFSLSEFLRILEVKRFNISSFQETTNKLLSKIINIPNPNGGYTGFQLFKECVLDKNDLGEWYIEIDAHDNALPLMFDFKKNYFKYELWNILRLKSINQIRLYEILKQYEKIGKREISLQDLRAYLGIEPEQYTRFNNFNQKVLKPNQKALKEYTDIKYEYNLIKKGTKVVAVEFIISENEDFYNQISLNEFMDEDIGCDIVETENREYQNEIYGFLAEACNNEFSEKEMAILFDLIVKIDLPDYERGVELARFDYLQGKYHEMDLRNPSKSRFGYLKKIIAADIEI